MVVITKDRQFLSYIDHYYTQSEEEHLRRKNRMLDDGSINKSSGFPEVHKVYNKVPNLQLRNKYSEKVKVFLKEHIFQNLLI